jgi:hypothetical protein
VRAGHQPARRFDDGKTQDFATVRGCGGEATLGTGFRSISGANGNRVCLSGILRERKTG